MCYGDDGFFETPDQAVTAEKPTPKKRATKKRKTNVSSTKPTRKSRRAKK